MFFLEASLLGQIFVLRPSNFRGATISRQFLDRNILLSEHNERNRFPSSNELVVGMSICFIPNYVARNSDFS